MTLQKHNIIWNCTIKQSRSAQQYRVRNSYIRFTGQESQLRSQVYWLVS